MLGNHDNRENFLKVFPDTPTTAEGHIQQVLDVGEHFRALLLDTLDGPPFDHSSNHGLLCPLRLMWLEQQLHAAQTAAKSVVVLLHHPPFTLGIPGMDSIRLKNDQETMDVLCR
jgi:3',5'-cyclic AMP phosphodiesterase CpdA